MIVKIKNVNVEGPSSVSLILIFRCYVRTICVFHNNEDSVNKVNTSIENNTLFCMLFFYCQVKDVVMTRSQERELARQEEAELNREAEGMSYMEFLAFLNNWYVEKTEKGSWTKYNNDAEGQSNRQSDL